MSTAQHDTSANQDDGNNAGIWIRDPDRADADGDHSGGGLDGHDEEESIEEPGYGHGV